MIWDGEAMKRFPIALTSVVLVLLTNIAFPGIAFAQGEQIVPPNATAARLDLGPKPMSRLVKFPGRVTDDNFDVTVIVKLEVKTNGNVWHLLFPNKLRKYDTFYKAIKTAAKKANVEPAFVDGKPAEILTYATFVFRQKDRKRSIYFFHHCGLEDPEHGLEYIGPQVIGGYNAFPEEIYRAIFLYNFGRGHMMGLPYYHAVINYEVAENGRAKNVKMIDENPRDSKWGPRLVAALARMQFIPANLDGKRISVGAADYIGE